MLEQTNSLLFDELGDHVAEHGSNGVEAFVGMADIGETHVIEQDLLDDEDSHRLAQFRAGFHDPKAQRDDLGRQ